MTFAKSLVHLYAIYDASANMVKIGRAKNPQHRLKSMQCGNPNPLTLMVEWKGCGPWEPDVHALLCKHRVRGEWFAIHPDVVQVVNEYGHDDIVALNKERQSALSKRRSSYTKERIGGNAYYAAYGAAAETYMQSAVEAA